MNKRLNNKDILFLTFVILLFLFIIIKFIKLTPLLLWDETVYLSNAYSHIDTSYFIEDFRFPLLEYFISTVWIFSGVSVISAQLLMLIFSIGTIISFYYLSKYIIKKKILNLLLTISFALSEIFLYWGYRIYTDIPSLCFLFIAILFFFKYYSYKNQLNQIYKKKPKGEVSFLRLEFNNFLTRPNIYLLLSGLFTSLSFLMRYPGAIIALIILPYLIYNKKIREFLIYGIGNAIILFPWMLYNFLNYGNILWDLLAQVKVISLYTHFESISQFVSNFLDYSNIYLFFLVIFLFFYFKGIKKLKSNFYQNVIVSLLFLSIIYYCFGVGLKLSRYQLSILPFVLLLAFSGVEYIFKYKLFEKKYFIVIFLLLFIWSIFINVNSANDLVLDQNHLYDNSAFLKSIDYAKENIGKGELVISNYWVWYGFYGNHKSRAIWDKNISLVLHDNDEGYLIINNLNSKYNMSELVYSGDLIKVFEDNNNNSVEIYKVYK